MRGNGRWIVVIVASLAAVAVMGVLAAQVQLDRAVEERCGTTLRPNPRDVIALRELAADIEAGSEGPMTPELVVGVAQLREGASDLESRCRSRQRMALLALGAGVAIAGAAVALSTYKLGYSAGIKKGAAVPASEQADGSVRQEASASVN